MPTLSASLPTAELFSQVGLNSSGTVVNATPGPFAPNTPSLSLLLLNSGLVALRGSDKTASSRLDFSFFQQRSRGKITQLLRSERKNNSARNHCIALIREKLISNNDCYLIFEHVKNVHYKK